MKTTKETLGEMWTSMQEWSASAEVCRLNFEWLQLAKAQLMIFLDTDVILGAMPSALVASALEERIQEAPNVVGPLTNVTKMTGPHTVRHYLDTLEQYCLPLGTLFEVERRLDTIRRDLTRSASELQLLFQYAEKKRPLSEVLRSTTESGMSRNIHTRILKFARRSEEAQLLGRLLANATNAESLADETIDPGADATYRKMLDHLNKVRPRRPINNFCDALNVGSVVNVFNCRIKKRTDRLLPVLISSTEPILERANLVEDGLLFGASRVERPRVLNSSLDMAISQSFLSYVGPGRYSGVVDYSIRLVQDCHALAGMIARLLASPKYLEHKEGEPLELEPFEMDRLIHLSTRFVSEWGRFFIPSVNRVQFDRAECINRMMSPEVNGMLESRKPDDVRKAMALLKDELRRFSPSHSLWESLVDYSSRSTEPTRLRAELELLLTARVPNDGTPLAETKATRPLSETDRKEMSGEHDFRIVVSQVHGFGGPILACDTSRMKNNGGEHRIRLVWCHDKDAEQVWNSGIALLRSIAARLNLSERECKFRLFSAMGIKSGSFDLVSQSGAPSLADADWDRSGFFDLTLGEFVFFADTNLLEDVEMQAGVLLLANAWTSSVLEAISWTVSQTAQLPLNGRYARMLLNHLRAVTTLRDVPMQRQLRSSQFPDTNDANTRNN